jgi:hypothetical protein
VLALFGITAMIVGILNPLKVIEPKADAERSVDATGGGGAPSSDPVSPPEASGGSPTGTAGAPAQSAGTPGKAEPPLPPVRPGLTVVYTGRDSPAGLVLLDLRQVQISSLSPEKSKALLADFAGRARGKSDANPTAAAVLSELSRSGNIPLEQA